MGSFALSVVCRLFSDICLLDFVAVRDGAALGVSPGGPDGPVSGRGDKICRAISKVQLHALLRVHRPPIDVVVYHGS